MTLPKGHIAQVKVTFYTWQFFPDLYLSWVTWIGMILHTIVVHDPGIVVAGVFVPLGVKKNMCVSSDPTDPKVFIAFEDKLP